MSNISNDTMVFARFYINALFNGASRELMKQRYPEWDFEADADTFTLKRTTSEQATPAVTPQGEAAAQPVDLKIGESDELAAATAAAKGAAASTENSVAPIVPVE